jgi:hypothetical protein
MNYKKSIIGLCLLFVIKSLNAQQHNLGIGLHNYKSPFISYAYQKNNKMVNIQFLSANLWQNSIKPVKIDTADFNFSDTLTMNLFQGEKRKPGVNMQVNYFLYNKNNLIAGMGIGYATSSILKRNASYDAVNSWIIDNDTTSSISSFAQQDSLFRNRKVGAMLYWGIQIPLSPKFEVMCYFSTTIFYSKEILEVEGFDRISRGLTWPDTDVGYYYKITNHKWQFQPISRPTIQLLYRF